MQTNADTRCEWKGRPFFKSSDFGKQVIWGLGFELPASAPRNRLPQLDALVR